MVDHIVGTERSAERGLLGATRDRDEWASDLGPADTCVSAVLAIPEVVADEQFGERGGFTEVIHPTAGTIRQVAAPLAGQVDASTLQVRDQSVPDTDRIMAQAGLSAIEIGELRDAGAIA